MNIFQNSSKVIKAWVWKKKKIFGTYGRCRRASRDAAAAGTKNVAEEK